MKLSEPGTRRNYSLEAQTILGAPTRVTETNGVIQEVEVWDGTKFVDVPVGKQAAIRAWAEKT